MSRFIVNIDKKERIQCDEDDDPDSGIKLLSALCEVKWPSIRKLMEKQRILPRKTSVSRGLGNLEIPEDIIYLIFSHIDSVRAAVALGASNTRLMIIGESRIEQLMGDPNWTGDRLIFLGDSWEALDCPGGLDVLGDDYEAFLRSDAELKNPYQWASGFPEPARDRWRTGVTPSMRSLLEKMGCDLRNPVPELRFALEQSKPIPVFVFEGNPDVIWNLTKRVYFRCDAIPEPSSYRLLRRFDKTSMIATILLEQIHWVDFGLRMRLHPEHIHCRGMWAGDRFQLTKQDVLETRLKEEGCDWKDVSEGVIEVFLDAYEWDC